VKLTRLQADLALGFAGLIWGFGFVAQKNALQHIGPFTFVAARFLVSALFVLLPALYENGVSGLKNIVKRNKNSGKILTLCLAFTFAVLVQQYALTSASVTNAAFLTGLYVVVTPFIGLLLYGYPLSPAILAASCLSVLGVWMLSESSMKTLNFDFSPGEGLVLLCAVGFAIHVSVMGQVTSLLRMPFSLSFVQYFFLGITALILALCFEKQDIKSIGETWLPILYAGVASGGIAYTLQAVAQQHTPSADAAIILSSEALFGGIGGVWLLNEKLTLSGIWGCCAIMAAIALVELSPLWKRHRTHKRKKFRVN
jgi:drug/metabolite transporter (DMT)-like permease